MTQNKLEAKELEEKVRAALDSVLDPEMGVSVVEMGLIRGVRAEADGSVEIEMMLTSPSCPFAAQLFESVERAASGVTGVRSVRVKRVAPEWWPKEMREQFESGKC